MKKTNDERYGGIGFSSEELKKKAELRTIELYGENYRSTVQQVKAKKTKLERYGNANYNNREKASLHSDRKKIYESYKNTMRTKYGVDNYFQTRRCRELCTSKEALIKSQDTRRQNGTLRTSKIEVKVRDYIETICPLSIEPNTRKYLDGLEIDIFIPSIQFGIEVQGDFFHKNPRFYTNPDEPANLPRRMHSNHQYTSVGDIWAYDKHKMELAESKGIQFIQIWAYDIKHNWDAVAKQIEERLASFPKD